MDVTDIVSQVVHGLMLTLWLSLPPILVASIVGTLFSLVQALTQIQEQTLSFAVKLIAVGLTLFLTARWVGGVGASMTGPGSLKRRLFLGQSSLRSHVGTAWRRSTSMDGLWFMCWCRASLLSSRSAAFSIITGIAPALRTAATT